MSTTTNVNGFTWKIWTCSTCDKKFTLHPEEIESNSAFEHFCCTQCDNNTLCLDCWKKHVVDPTTGYCTEIPSQYMAVLFKWGKDQPHVSTSFIVDNWDGEFRTEIWGNDKNEIVNASSEIYTQNNYDNILVFGRKTFSEEDQIKIGNEFRNKRALHNPSASIGEVWCLDENQQFSCSPAA
jgi:hypothetical protein